MAVSKRTTLIRGRRIRATKVDPAGRPIFGDDQAVVSKGLISIAYTTNTEEGEAINVPNFAGETCITDPATPSFNGYTVEIEFCEVDFALFNILTGQKIVLDAFGRVIGLRESTDVDLTAVNFALELWTGANVQTAASVGSQGTYGYILTPFLGGGVVGDLTVENDAVTFTVTNMSTRNGNGWGAGPYAVELVDGAPAVLSTPLELNDHRAIQTVEVAPPTIYAGSIPVLDPTDPALTSVTTTVSGKAVTFAPTPAGTDPVFYDFGDGEFDYAATGGYVHTYGRAGTFTWTATRGLSTRTGTVTVA